MLRWCQTCSMLTCGFFWNEVDTQADVGERRSWSCLRERTRATLGDEEEVE